MGKENRSLIPVVCFGSNMQDKQWVERTGSSLPAETVILPGQEIVFDTRSSKYPDHVVANIKPNPLRRVMARVRYLTPEALEILDGFELVYDRKPIEVTLSNGLTKSAEVYVAKPEFIIAHSEPHPDYLERILDGIKDAGDFPEGYTEEVLEAAKRR